MCTYACLYMCGPVSLYSAIIMHLYMVKALKFPQIWLFTIDDFQCDCICWCNTRTKSLFTFYICYNRNKCKFFPIRIALFNGNGKAYLSRKKNPFEDKKEKKIIYARRCNSKVHINSTPH